MMRIFKNITFVLFVLGVVSAPPAYAQFKVTRSAFSNGGTPVSDGSTQIHGSVGQPAVGSTSSSEYTAHGGIWPQTAGLITSIKPIETVVIPQEFRLEQNYPNPFNPTTIIQFAIPRPAEVRLKLYDVRGRQVATLVEEEFEAGVYKVTFDATGLASGVYFYRIRARDFVQTRKLILVK
ncbi:MAG: T9SS type A sorting domain-containing protein [bacterium]